MDPSKTRQRFKKISGKKFKGKFYRTVLLRDKDNLLEIWPSQIHGWRFNPKGEFGVLYLSEDLETCIREVFKRVPNTKVFLDRPRVSGTVLIQLQKYLDLTDPKVLAQLEVTEDAILSDGSEEALHIAREARQAGFEGILYRSAVNPAKKNIALFKDAMRPESFCKLVKTETISEEKLMEIARRTDVKG